MTRAIILFLLVTGCQQDSSSLSSDVDEAERVRAYENVKSSVVSIRINNRYGENGPQGSGFLVEESGYIITNYHVISPYKEGENFIEVEFDEDKDNPPAELIQAGLEQSGQDLTNYRIIYRAELIATIPSEDVALIRVPMFSNHRIRVPALTPRDEIKDLMSLYIIGNPMGQSKGVSSGIMSTINNSEVRVVDPATNRETLLDEIYRVDAAMSPGNSGGAVLSSQFTVIGVSVAEIRAAEGINFVIPIHVARRSLAGVLRVRRLVHRQVVLGETFDLYHEQDNVGLVLDGLLDGSAMRRAGLERGDRIVMLEQWASGKYTRIQDLLDFELFLSKLDDSTKVRLSYVDAETQEYNQCEVEIPWPSLEREGDYRPGSTGNR